MNKQKLVGKTHSEEAVIKSLLRKGLFVNPSKKLIKYSDHIIMGNKTHGKLDYMRKVHNFVVIKEDAINLNTKK